MIEYPSPGIFSLGLFNGQIYRPSENITLGSVLILTSINPTSGFTVLVPFSDIQLTDLSVENMMKFVVSGGMVVPSEINTRKITNINELLEE
jgi:uncharacterized membrane protein